MTADPVVFREAAEAAARRAPALAWLQDARDTALTDFSARGFPATTEEDWRYTDLAPAAKLTVDLAGRADHESVSPPAEWYRERLTEAGSALCVALLDGIYRPDLSRGTAPGLTVRTLGEASDSERASLAERMTLPASTASSALPALNVALLRDGLIIDVAPGATIQTPIVVAIGASSDRSTYNRVILRLGAGARATVVEHHFGAGASVSNSVSDVTCESDSALAYVKLQDEADAAMHIALQRFTLAQGARAELLHLDLGGKLARNDLHMDLVGRGAEIVAHGLFFADGSRHLDNHTRIDHHAPGTRSRELYRGIADGRGRGVFNGKVIVHPGADGTDAQLRNQNLLLAATAEIDTKPELEIYTDDVKCSHGATTGQLDANAVFYLRSRGIPVDEARRMLIASFAHEIIGHLPAGTLRRHVLDTLGARLPAIAEVARAP